MAKGFASALQDFYSHVEKTPHCWKWKGIFDADGYAEYDTGRRRVRAAVYMQECLRGRGDINRDFAMICGNLDCVKPEHFSIRGNQPVVLRTPPPKLPAGPLWATMRQKRTQDALHT